MVRFCFRLSGVPTLEAAIYQRGAKRSGRADNGAKN
jgi:hypothetical protein